LRIDEVLAYLKEVLPRENAEITAYTISRNRERAIGLFPKEGGTPRAAAIGGRENRSFNTVRVTLLLRWGRDGEAAAAKAAELYDVLMQRDFDYNGRGGFITAANDGPVWLGMDERGVFECVIDFDVFIIKEENHGISGK
jgi:hypothetical protein